jgi:hypothetical protein
MRHSAGSAQPGIFRPVAGDVELVPPKGALLQEQQIEDVDKEVRTRKEVVAVA